MSGKVNIAKVEELFGRGPEEEEYRPLAAFSRRAWVNPAAGEVHREADMIFTVEEADGAAYTAFSTSRPRYRPRES